MGKLFVTLFAHAEVGFGFAEIRFAPVRRGVYPAKRGSSTFAPALKTDSVNKITILPFTRTCPLRKNRQILLLTPLIYSNSQNNSSHKETLLKIFIHF